MYVKLLLKESNGKTLINHNFFKRFMQTHQQPTTNRRTRLLKMQMAFMWDLWRQDFTVKEIAEIYGISPQYVQNLIDRHWKS